MKTNGLIGGSSWYSSTAYYRYINHGVNNKPGAQGVIFGCAEIPLSIQQQYRDIMAYTTLIMRN